jgi:hypothetical protein
MARKPGGATEASRHRRLGGTRTNRRKPAAQPGTTLREREHDQGREQRADESRDMGGPAVAAAHDVVPDAKGIHHARLNANASAKNQTTREMLGVSGATPDERISERTSRSHASGW